MLFVTANTFFVRDRKPIIELAAKHRLPAIYEWPEQVEEGGLMAYGPASLTATYRRIAAKIDRILEGANPGELPVEQPSRLELVIILKTAKAIGPRDTATIAAARGPVNRMIRESCYGRATVDTMRPARARATCTCSSRCSRRAGNIARCRLPAAASSLA